MADPAAWLPHPDRIRVRVAGADALDFLHRMTTQDVARASAGDVRPACLLNAKGRILGTFLVLVGEGAATLVLDAAAWARIEPVLSRMAALMDVSLEPVADAAAEWSLVGDGATARIDRMGALPLPAAGTFVEGPAGVLHRRDVGSVTAYGWRIPQDVLAEGPPADARMGPAAFEALRIEAGVPREGVDFDETTLFNEAGLWDHVSFQKGCFPGQEPVVMARDRGHPPRHLCRLALDGPVASGDALLADGRDVGGITSLAPSGALALGMVRHAAAVPEARLDTASGGVATLVAIL